jgi:hypothetical protein
MLRKFAPIALLAIISSADSVHSELRVNPSAGGDFTEACNAYGELAVAFVGRLGEPTTFHMSGEEEIEKARQDVIRTQAEVARLRGLLDAKTVAYFEREFVMAVHRAEEEFNRRRAMYPPPYDLTCIRSSSSRHFVA